MTGPNNLSYNDKKSIFISEAGLYCLILSSKKKEALEFKKFVTETVLPSIRKTGSFSLSSNNEQLIPKPIRTKPIKSFYDDHMITPFLGKNVLYIGMSDNIIDNFFANKYGLSTRVIERDFKEHRKHFINFNMVYIRECDNNVVVEKLFENELKAKNLWRTSKINNSTDTELFITNDTYDMNYIFKLMDSLIDNNPLKSIQDRDNIIKHLENNQNLDIHKLNIELKLKELELKMKEEDNRNSQIECEFKLKQTELELQQKQFDLLFSFLSTKFF